MTKVAAAAVNYTCATLAAEKMKPSGEAISLCEKIADGQISGDQAVREILIKYHIKPSQRYE